MNCYKDKTFCTAPCAFEGCPDDLTVDVEAEARALGLPIWQADFSTDCEYYRPLRPPIEDYDLCR